MKMLGVSLMSIAVLSSSLPARADGRVLVSGERKENNLVSRLLEVTEIAAPRASFPFVRSGDGWIFISAECRGDGKVSVHLDDAARDDTVLSRSAASDGHAEGVRYVQHGEHRVHVECDGKARVERLVVKAIPDLIHSGLGFDPAIKAFGHYDMDFFKKDILPNATTLFMPASFKLPQSVIDDWHRQGKRFIVEFGIDANAKTAEEHAAYWMNLLEKVPFADGFIIDEFIINRPIASERRSRRPIPPGPRPRLDAERQKEHDAYPIYEQAIKLLRTDRRLRDKTLYFYFGGSGTTLNQEIIGPTIVHTIRKCRDRLTLERYIFERSSEKRSRDALREFVDGIADWNRKEPGANRDMVIAFGLFSMPPFGLNKLPNVDYHVWMDQQMHVVATDPVMAGMGGLEWWTTALADEETVRFVGKLYRHYAIEGKTDLMTHDPLFLKHLDNADFEQGTVGWELHAAEAGSIQPKGFPRYGHIQMRFMGQNRPPDPEHIGDTFLWMKRSPKGPNTFSQTIKNLVPGRLYSFELLSCDHQDLLHPQAKTMEQANKFIGTVALDGVDIDPQRSFREMYPTGPEYRMPTPIWITYHWTILRAKSSTARLTVSDWTSQKAPQGTFGQEQIFNFLELQPYHE
jgi:hypothetical protein